MKVDFVIKEINDLQYDWEGIFADSIVFDPALPMAKFIKFAPDKVPFFKYTADPEIIPESHKFCKEHAGKIFHISEIKNLQRTDDWIPESNYFKNFNDSGNYNIDEQIYNCRHWFKRVTLSEVPKEKLWMMNAEHIVKFSIENREKHHITGIVLKSNEQILRLSLSRPDGTRGPGYVVFTNNAVIQAFRRSKLNSVVTFEHNFRDYYNKDLRGTKLLEKNPNSIIVLHSWLEENKGDLYWNKTFEVNNNELWDIIDTGKVTGFSIEGDFLQLY